MRMLIYASVLFFVACGQTEDPDSPEARAHVVELVNANKKEGHTIVLGNLVEEALAISKMMGVQIRTNIDADGLLRIDNLNHDTAIFVAAFKGSEPYYPNGSKKSADLLYKNPSIIVNKRTFLVLSNPYKYDSCEVFAAKSYVAHEFAHYFDTTKWNNKYWTGTKEDRVEPYILQKSEFNAHAVGAYYFFSKCNKPLLDSIASLDVSFRKQKKLLIEKFKRLVNGDSINLDEWESRMGIVTSE